MSLNDAWESVRTFHDVFGHPVPRAPSMLDEKRARTRAMWMYEELAEFLLARDIYNQADAMIDLIYFALGTMVEMGIKPQELFDVVQEANMSKLWPDGKPHFKHDGKVCKPATWIDPGPRLKNVIDAACKECEGR